MLIDGFNTTCKNISASSLKVGDASMNEIRFQTTKKGNLLHLSYIFGKPEPMGAEFKTVACYVTGGLVFIEIQIGKEVMNHSKYQKDLGATAACTKIIMEATKEIG